MSVRSSLTLPPALWAVISDETLGLRWICHSYAPLQAAQGTWNQGRPLPPPLNVRVAWPLLEFRLRVGRPCFSKYCSVPLASASSPPVSLSIVRLPLSVLISIFAVVAPLRGSNKLSVSRLL